jgi:hypothetical protein
MIVSLHPPVSPVSPSMDSHSSRWLEDLPHNSGSSHLRLCHRRSSRGRAESNGQEAHLGISNCHIHTVTDRLAEDEGVHRNDILLFCIVIRPLRLEKGGGGLGLGSTCW